MGKARKYAGLSPEEKLLGVDSALWNECHMQACPDSEAHLARTHCRDLICDPLGGHANVYRRTLEASRQLFTGTKRLENGGVLHEIVKAGGLVMIRMTWPFADTFFQLKVLPRMSSSGYLQSLSRRSWLDIWEWDPL